MLEVITSALAQLNVEDIEQSSLCLYEISTPNNNVYFECGLGLGLNCPGILFARDNKRATGSTGLQIPPLLKGVLRFDYLDYTDIIERIAGKVSLILKTYSDKRLKPAFIHFLGAEMPKREKRCEYAAILDHNHFGDQRDYRLAMKEVLEEAGLRTVFPLDEHVRVDDYLSETTKGNASPRLMDMMGLLRHAGIIVSRVEDVKDSKDTSECHLNGQAFIGLGYAFGINETLTMERLRIQMTLLSQDQTGRPIDAPSDLGGYPFVRYRNFEELKTHFKSKLSAGA